MITSGSQFPYQAFLSYRNATDYSRARWIESFLEGFHKNLGTQTKPMEQVQVCRDGSDFRLPTARDSSKGQDVVWEIIRGELAKSEFLLVLCSPGICESKWADREIGWFLANHPDRILLAVTQAENPELHPEECFPNSILTREMHKSQIWYDLRGHERVQRKRGIRNWEDEMVRLAADLLRWDAQKHGSLATTYQREQLRRRKRQATAISLAATAMLALASLGAWFAWQSNVQAKQARSSAIVASAQALPDPLTSALLLTELDDDEPQRGVEVARAIAAERLASAELRGPPSALGEIQFVPGTNAVAAVASDGSLWFWPHDGRGDPLTPGFSVKQNPVNLAIRADGHVFATAIREQQALVWSPGGASLQKYQTPGPIQSIDFLPWDNAPSVLLEDGRLFVLDANGRVRQSLPQTPPIALIAPKRNRKTAVIAARDGTIYELDLKSYALRRRPDTPASILSDFPFNGPNDALLSPDGEWYAISFNGHILLRSTVDPRRYRILDYGALTHTLAFSADSKVIAAGGSKGKVILWETITGRKIQEFDSKIRFWLTEPSGRPSGSEPGSLTVNKIRFSPLDSNVIAALTDDSVLRVWDARGGNPIEFRGHTGADTLAWNSSATEIATGADTGTVRLWPIGQPDEPRLFQHPEAVDRAFVLRDGRIVTLARDKIVREMRLGQPALRALPTVGKARSLAADLVSSRVAVGFEDGIVRIAEGNPLVWVRSLKLLTEPIAKVELRGNVVLGASELRTAVADWNDLTTTHVYPPAASKIWSAKLDPRGREFVTTHEDGEVNRVFRYANREPQKLAGANQKPVFEANYSPDGNSLITCSQNGKSILYTLNSRQGAREIHIDAAPDEWMENCAFSPDGKWLIVTASSGRAWVAHADGGEPQLFRRRDQLAHVGSITSISFSVDSMEVLLTGGVDGDATLWNLRSHHLLTVLTGHAGAITDGCVSADGNYLLTASEDGTVRIWRSSWQELLDYFRLRTTATLSPEQRIALLGESENQAQNRYRAAEQKFGRSGRSLALFRYPY